jgi:hypothetical protein
MLKKRLLQQRFKKKLFAKNRLIILNEDSFEEVFSLKLNLMNVFVVVSLGTILIITVTTFLIAFTPLKEFIPGFPSSKLKKDATELALKSDSLAIAIKKNELYLASIKKVLNGQLDYAKINKDSILIVPEAPQEVDMSASKQEMELRNEEKNSKKKTPFMSAD